MTTQTKKTAEAPAPIEALAAGPAPGPTAEQIDQLNADLDMARVKKRQGYDYLPEHDVIRVANRIFGFGKWGTEVLELACIGEEPEYVKDGKKGYYVGYRCTV